MSLQGTKVNLHTDSQVNPKFYKAHSMVDSSPLSLTINLYHLCLVSSKEPHQWHLLEFRDWYSP